jgi:TolB-like protein/DNA-binding winged helix-turn-helix (wHTH) protein/Tfp pilus assembly protein PilF
MPTTSSQRFAFGDGYELDLGAYELRRDGRALKLPRIPMEVLRLLLERRGNLVTREEIIERIWGREVFVDTDNSINAAIRRVRQVLNDDADEPHFIQTVPAKGYRFIAAVTEMGLIAGNSSASAEEAAAVETVRMPEGISPDQISPDQISPDQARLTAVSQPPAETKNLGLRRWAIGPTIALLLVTAVGVHAGWFRRPVSTLPPPRVLLAVLPFENLTGDAGQEYFSDGMTEEMITQLGGLDPEHLGVIARTSVMHYKRSQEQLQQIARELGVQYVLEGSVRRDGERVRITAQLIQMKDQTHLWARQYDREPKDVLVVQSEIAKQIAGEIQRSLGEHGPIAPIPQPTLSAEAFEAYNLYLKGQYFWNKRTVEGFQEAIGYFRQAIDKDPNYARAYAGLAASYTLIGTYTGAPAAESASLARAAALRALQLDDSLPEAHAALALIVQNHDYDWQTAEKEFKRAIELNPNYATGHHWYAEHLAWQGRFDEALRESERARQLDPLSLIIAVDNGAILYYSRRYDRAIAQFTTVRELDPSFPRTAIIFAAYVQKGMFAEAEVDIEKHMPGDNPWHWSSLAYTYGRAGNQAQAEHALKKLLDLNQRQLVDPTLIVPAYIGIGNNDRAIIWLEKAYAQHSNGLTAIKVDPTYDPLRDDPRFQNLLRRVGFIQ